MPLQYLSYIERETSLTSYRLDHCPRDGLAPVFICPFVVMTGASGKTYQAMRGFQAQEKGGVLNFGIYDISGDLDEQGPLVVPYSEMPIHTPYWVTQGIDAVSLLGDNFRFDLGIDDFTWNDANDRMKLHAKRIGQVHTFWVPAQPGSPLLPQMLRSHAGKVTGTIDDDPVEGLFMIDYIYSRPDTTMWHENGLLSKLHNIWLNWLVEYEDGSYEGGLSWRGREGTGFAATHHIVDGVSTARSDAVIETFHTERGTIERVELSIGNEVNVELEQRGSCDWPMHTCGTVSTDRGKAIAKSWNYTEFIAKNFPDFMEFRRAYQQLYGKPLSWKRGFENAVVRDQRLEFRKPL